MVAGGFAESFERLNARFKGAGNRRKGRFERSIGC